MVQYHTLPHHTVTPCTTTSMNAREKTFFDDPEAYPEYSLLVKRERLSHAFRIGLHRHRFAIY